MKVLAKTLTLMISKGHGNSENHQSIWKGKPHILHHRLKGKVWFQEKNRRDAKKKIQKCVTPCINSPVLNKTASLPLDTKIVTTDLKPNATIK